MWRQHHYQGKTAWSSMHSSCNFPDNTLFEISSCFCFFLLLFFLFKRIRKLLISTMLVFIQFPFKCFSILSHHFICIGMYIVSFIMTNTLFCF